MLDFINKKRSNRVSAQVSANQTQKPLKSSRISVKYIITETKTIPVLLAMMFIVALIPIVSNIKRQQSTNAALIKQLGTSLTSIIIDIMQLKLTSPLTAPS